MRFRKPFFYFVLFLLVTLFTSNFKVNSPKINEKQASKDVLSTTNVLDYVPVLKVVDGDTLEVMVGETHEKVRVLGINSPETVDPRKPVECFGKEASNEAKRLLTSAKVNLTNDATQADKDKYGRLLRYVTLPDGSDFGLMMIKEGYAYEYTYDIPYARQKEYKAAQESAQFAKKGLWADNTCTK